MGRPNASGGYYLREARYGGIKKVWDIGNNMARAATMRTYTEYTRPVLGSGGPGKLNKTVAETMPATIEKARFPQRSEADVALAKAVHQELKVQEIGLSTKNNPLRGRELIPDYEKRGGGSDDIGDISW